MKSLPSHVSRLLAVAVPATFVFAVAFLVRIANLPVAMVNGTPQFSPFDDLYHAKRIVYSATHFPRVLSFDANRGAAGLYCPWPPLYDLTAGAAARLLGGRTPLEIAIRSSWFAPILASLLAAAIAAWFARRFDALTGFLAGIGIATAPYFLDKSRFAAIDHHFLELPLVLALFAATLLAARSNRTRAVRNGLVLGLALTSGLLVQTALLLAAALAALAFLALPPRNASGRLAGAIGFGLAAAMIFVYGGTQPEGYPISHWYLGIPHAALLAGAAIACAVQSRAIARGGGRLSAAALGVVIGGLAVAAVPEALPAILGGSRFLGGGDPWLRSISEFQPLVSGTNPLWPADLGGGPLVTLAMVATPLWRRGARALLLLFAVAYALAGLSSMRFLAVAAPLGAISAAIAVFDLRRLGRQALAAAAAVLLLVPGIAATLPRVLRPAPEIRHEMAPLLRTAEVLRFGPPGRVLGPWSWGHLFDVTSGRGVLLDNFGSAGGRTDFENGVGIIFSTREADVASYCDSNGVRFVVLQDPHPFLAATAEIAGFPRSAFALPDGSPTRLARSTFWWRAYFRGGQTPGGTGFQRFRLLGVEREKTEGEKRSAVQIWEIRSARPRPSAGS